MLKNHVFFFCRLQVDNVMASDSCGAGFPSILQTGFLHLHISSNAQAQTPASLSPSHPNLHTPNLLGLGLSSTIFQTLTLSLFFSNNWSLYFSSSPFVLCRLPSPHLYGIYLNSTLVTLLSDCFSRGFRLANVGLKEELDKKHKVAEVHEGGPHNVLHVGRTLLTLLHP